RVTTRREFLQSVGAATAVLALPLGCSSSPAPSFFSDGERRALGALADVVLPPDDTAGGAALGTVEYVERLLTAFERDPPLVFAGGPFSGRTPYAEGAAPPNGFTRFLPLDRVSERAWRLYLYGSAGVPGGGPNDTVLGPVVGLRDEVRDGLATAMRAAPAGLETLDLEARKVVFQGLPPDFRATLVELVAQAAFSAPE